MKKLLNLVALPVMAVVLTGGIAAAGTNSVIDTTGPGSDQTVTVDNENDVVLENTNDTDASIDNDQSAVSGDARTETNTTGGDATSGDSETEFAVSAAVDHTNASSSDFALRGSNMDNDVDSTIENTGPNSTATVTVENSNDVEVTNDNTFELDVTNTQRSRTGDATVRNNTTGGDAKTGDAKASASVEIKNFTSN